MPLVRPGPTCHPDLSPQDVEHLVSPRMSPHRAPRSAARHSQPMSIDNHGDLTLRTFTEPRPSRSTRLAQGEAARIETPLEAHAELVLPADRDPLGLLHAQDESREPELLPLRYERMSASPFAFLRGSAVVMAADLAAGPRTQVRAQLCGDAHVANFGMFAAPDRRLVFDLNDFDETLPGPFEWDVKRLAASVAVAGRQRGIKPKKIQGSDSRHGGVLPHHDGRVVASQPAAGVVHPCRRRSAREGPAGNQPGRQRQASQQLLCTGHRRPGDRQAHRGGRRPPPVPLQAPASWSRSTPTTTRTSPTGSPTCSPPTWPA